MRRCKRRTQKNSSANNTLDRCDGRRDRNLLIETEPQKEISELFRRVTVDQDLVECLAACETWRQTDYGP
jgi:hypothetical protein